MPDTPEGSMPGPADLTSKRPGGELRQKPIEINGVAYDPLQPPKLYQNKDGTQEYRGGKPINKDAEYARRYWETRTPAAREVMIQKIHESAKTGKLGRFVAREGIDEEDREALSAQRELARELGYTVGEYKFDRKTGIAMATMSREARPTSETTTEPEATDISDKIVDAKAAGIAPRKILEALANTDNNRPEEASYNKGGEIGRGGNSIAYEVQGRPDLVLIEVGSNWGGGSSEALQKMYQTHHQLMEREAKLLPGVNAPKILKVELQDNELVQVMEKSKGRAVHESRESFGQWSRELQEIAAAPVEQYAKLASDVKAVNAAGLMIDPSKPSNFFYDQATGFHLIDLGVDTREDPTVTQESSLATPLIHAYNLFTAHRGQIDDKVRQSVRTILNKLQQVGAQPNRKTIDSMESILSAG